MTQLRFGILTTGNIARQFAQGVADAQRCRITAVGSRSQSTAAAFAETYHIPNVHGSYEALIADPQVDAVYVATPNNLHHEWTLRALRAGKHVLCEKPIAVTAAQAAEMFEVARQSGKVLVEAFMYRSHPVTEAWLKQIRQGAIGRVKLIRAGFCFNVVNWRENTRFSVPLAGGSIMDIGCYCVDLAQLVLQREPTQIHVDAHLHESGIDDYAAGTLRFDDDAMLSFACGMSVQANNAAMICGDKGYIEIPVPWKPPVEQAQFIIDGQMPPRQDRSGGVTRREREVFSVDADKALYALEADDFAATVFDGRQAAILPEESLSNMRVLDELRRQAGLPF